MIYVWRGKGVLQEYSSGLVVVEAPDIESAWAKLRVDNFGAFHALQTGQRSASWYENESQFNAIADEEDREVMRGYPKQPEAFEPGALPTLVLWGRG